MIEPVNIHHSVLLRRGKYELILFNVQVEMERIK